MPIINGVRKRWGTVILLLCMSAVLSACTTKENNQPAQKEERKEPLIGMSFDSFLIERWQTDRDFFVDAARAEGVNVNVQNANGDVETQLSQIRYLISKPVDVLVVIGIDADTLTDVVAEAKEAGIPVIAYDRMIRDGNADLYISFDNEKVGRLMGEALARYSLQKRKVLMLNGPTEDNNVILISDGFRQVMDKYNIKVVEEYNVPGWKPEQAVEYLTNHREILDEIDGIMCGNDNIATAVSRTLAELRMAGKISVVGQDADLEACQRIVQGTQVMTVYKPVELMAKEAAKYACRLAKGGNLNDVALRINDGSEDIPYVVLDPIAVTKFNIDDTVISAGFHLEEDVYLYVPGHEKK
ncbi:MAG: substrate-binding domain-containing protein [Lachnospiraceae bacterium]|nr:substrate-binding domain-containing protein [Lachnospiraceae bacterium]